MTTLRRVLITYFAKPPILEYLGRAFQRAGVAVRTLHAEENSWFDRRVIHRVNKLAHNLRLLPKHRHLFADHPLAHRNYRSRRLLEAYTEFGPDLVLVIRGIGFRPDVLAQTRPLFGWWIEQEGRSPEVMAEVGSYDWYYCINDAYVQEARAAGHGHVSALAHAVDPDCFHPLPDVARDIDVCFVGGWSPRRQRYLEAALRVTSNVVIYGGKWSRRCAGRPEIMKCWKGSYIEGPALNHLYNRSRIVLNITNWAKDGQHHSGMTMRVLEVPASGAFLLTDESTELRALLVPHEHLEVFGDIDDFSRKLGHYLGHEAEREAIARAGAQHVRDHHTYDQMVREIMARHEALTRKRAGLTAPAGDAAGSPAAAVPPAPRPVR